MREALSRKQLENVAPVFKRWNAKRGSDLSVTFLPIVQLFILDELWSSRLSPSIRDGKSV
tara:strand:+ start:794 stop:973 length:180 start_codon:yes stop_codon:yes gene_type:complete